MCSRCYPTGLGNATGTCAELCIPTTPSFTPVSVQPNGGKVNPGFQLKEGILVGMGWTVVLEGEHKDPIACLSAEFRTGVNLDQETFRLLCYLDLYGDTTFNGLQIPDLLRDLARLLAMEPNPLGDELTALVKRSQEDVHLYVCFYGD